MSDYLRMFGAYSKDRELLLSSSSGGMFMTLARATIWRGDAVICAVMDVDTKSVVFKLIENESGLYSAQGSKYVQSLPGTVLHDAKSWLERHPDKGIMCFGMGCQIAGFHSFFMQSGFISRVVLVDIICHGSVVIHTKGHADGTVNVNVQNRGIVFTVAQSDDSVSQPFYILKEQTAVLSQLGIHIVDQGVRQYVGAFHDHFIGIVIAVISRLGKNRNLAVLRIQPVFFCDNFAHQHFLRLCYSIQD